MNKPLPPRLLTNILPCLDWMRVYNVRTLTDAQRLTETFLFGLRMNEGVDLDALQKRYGVCLSGEQQRTLEHLMEDGLCERRGTRIRTTPRGRLVLDEISVRLI